MGEDGRALLVLIRQVSSKLLNPLSSAMRLDRKERVSGAGAFGNSLLGLGLLGTNGTARGEGQCHGFVNRSAIEVGVWRFVEGGEHGGAIRDGGSTSLPSFRSHNGGEILRAATIHYMATSARLQ
jgi:hypothetical protein